MKTLFVALLLTLLSTFVAAQFHFHFDGHGHQGHQHHFFNGEEDDEQEAHEHGKSKYGGPKEDACTYQCPVDNSCVQNPIDCPCPHATKKCLRNDWYVCVETTKRCEDIGK